MSESMSANHRRRHAKSSNPEMCDLEASSSSLSLIREDARNAPCPPPKARRRRSSRRGHDRRRPDKGNGGHRDRRKAEEAMSMDVSMSRSARCQPSKRTSRRSSRRRHERKRPEKGHGGYRDRRKTERSGSTDASVATPSPNPRRRSKHRDLSSRDSPIRDRSTRKCRCTNDEEERREVVEKEIKHVKKNAKVDLHCDYESNGSPSKPLGLSNRKHGRHAHNFNGERYVSSSSPMHNKLESSENYKNNNGGSPRRSKQLAVHGNNGRNKNRIVADHRTYIGPSMFLDESGRSFARRMISERLRRDQQWKEGRFKRLKNKMAIIFHHHHHHHHRHGRLVEVLERLARYVWRPEKGVAGRRRGGSGAQRRCLWWRRGGGGGMKVGRRRQPVLLLSRRRSPKKTVSLGDKKGKRN